MKSWLRRSKSLAGICSLACLGGALVARVPGAAAQTPTEAMWANLHQADARISASQVRWKETYTQQPQPGLDIEKLLAGAQAQWRQQGVDPSNFKQLIEVHRQVYERDRAGWQKSNLLVLTRQGKMTRAEVSSSGSVRIGAAASALSASPGHIEFYNGQDAVNVSSPAQAPGPASAHPVLIGSLRRNSGDVLPHVGIGNLPFLSGSPLFSDYSPANSTLREAGGNIVLEKHARENWGAPVPVVLRWTISRQTWRPMLMEQRIDTAANANPILRVRFSEYRRCPGAVLFPGKVVKEEWGGRPEAAGQQAPLSSEYQLLEGKFNEFVDTLPLRRPFPQGTVIDDYRFAPRMNAMYKVVKGIPDDDEVLKLVEQREAADAGGGKVSRADGSRGYDLKQAASLPLGLLLLVAGFLLLKGPRRRTSR